MKLVKGKQGKVKKYAIGGVVGGAVGAAAGIGQAIYGFSQAKKTKAEMQRLLQGAPKLDLPSAYQEYAQKAQDRAMLRAQTEQINRRLATSTEALSKAGGRALLGGLQQSVTSANQAQIAATDAQLQREMQGLQVLGGAQAQNMQMREQRFQMQYGAADAARQAALGNIGAGIATAGKGIVTAAGSFEGGGTTSNPNDEESVAKQGMKTKGEFSHETNPIDLVDKKGKKIGEATGGEYIINPKQAAAISKESKYFRNLLKKKRFK